VPVPEPIMMMPVIEKPVSDATDAFGAARSIQVCAFGDDRSPRRQRLRLYGNDVTLTAR